MLASKKNIMADATITREVEKSSKEFDKEIDSPKTAEVANEFATSTPERDNTSRSPTLLMRKKARWQMFAACFCLFLAGWDGGTVGPLLPKIQSFYHVNFISNAISKTLICGSSPSGRFLGRFIVICFQLRGKILFSSSKGEVY